MDNHYEIACIALGKRAARAIEAGNRAVLEESRQAEGKLRADQAELRQLRDLVTDLQADKFKGLDMIRDRLDANPATVVEAVEGLIGLYKIEFDERFAAETRVAELEDENQRLEGQWLDGGSHPEDIESGTRVHYHPIRGESEYRAGATRGKPGLNASGLWLVHVDLDDGKTICSAHIRHLRREPEDVKLRARVAEINALVGRHEIRLRDADARVAELEASLTLSDFHTSNHPPEGTRVLLVYSYLRGRETPRKYIDCQVIVSAGSGTWRGSDGKHLRNHGGDWIGWLPLSNAVPDQSRKDGR